MSYLAQMLAGYRQGLTGEPLQPVEDLEAALAEAKDPKRRGALLGGLARTLTLRDRHTTNIDETALG
jgi:hypothetical protein